MRTLILGIVAAVAFSGVAVAGPVTLKANPVDSDGRVTLGDIFDGTGAASSVAIGARSGPSVVFEAGQLQSLARQAGLDWANPTGLRRVVVRNAALSSGATSAPLAEGITVAEAHPSLARVTYAGRVISRNDIIEVAYETGGIRLTITGRAEGNAATGQRIAIRNLQSNRVIDAIAVAPGQAIAGPGAQAIRTQQFAAR